MISSSCPAEVRYEGALPRASHSHDRNHSVIIPDILQPNVVSSQRESLIRDDKSPLCARENLPG